MKYLFAALGLAFVATLVNAVPLSPKAPDVADEPTPDASHIIWREAEKREEAEPEPDAVHIIW